MISHISVKSQLGELTSDDLQANVYSNGTELMDDGVRALCSSLVNSFDEILGLCSTDVEHIRPVWPKTVSMEALRTPSGYS